MALQGIAHGSVAGVRFPLWVRESAELQIPARIPVEISDAAALSSAASNCAHPASRVRFGMTISY
jgi:hypothetical protein